MFKIILLLAVLALVLWSLWNIEGFQNPPNSPSAEVANSQSQCETLISMYKALENNYNKAVFDNNANLIETNLIAVNSMKDIVRQMNCSI